VGIAYSQCSHRLYVTDAREDQTVWYFFQEQSGVWTSAGVLASEPADRAATPPVLQGIAVSCPAEGDARSGGEIFAAGPGGLFVYGPDGTLIARFVLSERIAGLTWGPEGALYMTIGHRLARLVTNAGKAQTDVPARPTS
jgi:gluconolactonase